MLNNQSFSKKTLQQASNLDSLSNSLSLGSFSRVAQKNDNTFASAKRLGTLRASSSPVTLKFNGQLDRKDRDDFVKLEIAPGATFASTKTQINFKDGNLRVTSYLALPNSAPQKVSEFQYRPGKNVQLVNSPVSNPFGLPIQIFVQIRTLKPSKDIFYNASLTFSL
jgi:hypothetical protein